MHTPFRPSEEARRRVTCTFFVHPSCARTGDATRADTAVGSGAIELHVPLTGVEAHELEVHLQRTLKLKPFCTVFTIVRSDEWSTAPPLPLRLLHGIVDECETACSIDCVVRPMIQARPEDAPPLHWRHR